MIAKDKEWREAIELRRKGLSYREIREKIPVAKSTLSLWFKEVKLSKPQVQRLTEKKRLAGLRGAQRRHEQRVQVRSEIVAKAEREIGSISARELWLIGVALYWAEGHKEKEYRGGALVQFTNSDPWMLKMFLKWLEEFVGISMDRLRLSLYIHENSQNSIKQAKEYWKKILGVPEIHAVYLKKGNPKTKRKNVVGEYFGLVRVTVNSSINLNREIEGWIKGIRAYCSGIV